MIPQLGLDSDKLVLLKTAAEEEDWLSAADVCLEISLESKGTKDEFFVEELELAVRLALGTP